jgi:hypothetical protein
MLTCSVATVNAYKRTRDREYEIKLLSNRMSNNINVDTKNEHISSRSEPYHKRLDELERRIQELEAHRDSQQKRLPPVGTAAYYRATHESGCHCTKCDPAGN